MVWRISSVHSWPWNETVTSHSAVINPFTVGSYRETLELKAYVIYWNLYRNL
jgi:hypothetical protein